MLQVLEMAPDRNGWTAPIIRMWPMWWMGLSPMEVANTATCSARISGQPTTVWCSSIQARMAAACWSS